MAQQEASYWLIRWLILVAAVAVGLFVAWYEGLFHTVFYNDASRLSLVIVLVFALSTAHAGWMIRRLMHNLSVTEKLGQLLGEKSRIASADHELIIDGVAFRNSGAVYQYLLNLVTRFEHAGVSRELLKDQTNLLSALGQRIRSPHRTGWLIADLMIKLGLLGTVIGFVLMLQSIAHIEDVDISTVQSMLTNMGGGMRVALFTTLCGLSGGLMAGMQYQMVDRSADDLMVAVTEMTESRLVPRLLVQ